MPKPLAICLEDLEPGAGRPRYLRCVAVVGRAPGLRVDGAGVVLWKSDEAAACELWVSQDDKLILYRPDGGAPVTVHREGRSLAAPAGKPVVLLDQDRFEVGARRLRVHVHGVIDHVYAPSPLPEPASTGRARAAVAVAALGATLGAADCKKAEPTQDVEVRATPPAVPWGTDVAPLTPDATGLPSQDVVDASAMGPDGEPIEVRVTPPAVAVRHEDVTPTAPDAGAASPDVSPDGGAASPDVSPDAAPDASPDATADVPPQRDRTPRIEVRAHPPAMPIRRDSGSDPQF
jgi:hypothetical protein